MDKDAYIDWLQQQDTKDLIQLANDWGLILATKITTLQNDLQTFEQYLVDHYSNTVVPGFEAYQYDQIKGDLL